MRILLRRTSPNPSFVRRGIRRRRPLLLTKEKDGMRLGGFSLVESLVIISIISVLTAMSLTGIPAIRAHQELVSDTENIRALLLDAKQRTINQVRPEGCLPDFDVEDAARAACSDTGIALVNGELVLFAHTTAAQSLTYNTRDFVITKSKLASKVDKGGATSLLFVGVPPSAVLYKNGVALNGGNDSANITLTASNGQKRRIKVYSFGTIDVQ